MAEFVPADPFDLVIFGGTGDLARRKLLPALFHRDCDHQFSDDSRIIAVARDELDTEGYKGIVHAALGERVNGCGDPVESWARFAGRLHYLQMNATHGACWDTLDALLDPGRVRIRVFYLATSPKLFGPIATGLASSGIRDARSRIVLEKPVGDSAESAQKINQAVGEAFAEDRIYRIDHFLGKETVQNLLVLRFANSLFEPLWRRGSIDHVQITVAEDIGVGSRAQFYEHTGALRDMVQNHLLQLLCLVAMEAPSTMHHDNIRSEKLKVLNTLRIIPQTEIKNRTVRGQYTAGMVGGEAVPGYREELAATKSQTETFVALRVEVDNWRWSGTPFYLRTGKRLARKSSEIVFQFEPVAHSIFDKDVGELMPNRLIVRLQPDEGVMLSLMTKEPGPGGFRLRSLPLDLSFAESFEIQYPDAYERLLMEVLRGNPALFMRRDEVDAAWHWTDEVLRGWEKTGQEVQDYMAGCWGPIDSFVLLDRDRRRWHHSGA
jgi:glucose-6-phosphate 1-dehydrogenase